MSVYFSFQWPMVPNRYIHVHKYLINIFIVHKQPALSPKASHFGWKQEICFNTEAEVSMFVGEFSVTYG